MEWGKKYPGMFRNIAPLKDAEFVNLPHPPLTPPPKEGEEIFPGFFEHTHRNVFKNAGYSYMGCIGGKDSLNYLKFLK